MIVSRQPARQHLSLEDRDDLAVEAAVIRCRSLLEAFIHFVGDTLQGQVLEDYDLAESRARLNRKSIPLADVERELGLAD